MQTFAQPHAHAQQQLPDGWAFPTMSALQPPTPTPTRPVSGGGGETATVTRMRWGRVLPLVAGLALLAFGIWTATGSPGGSSSTSSSASATGTVSGGGGAALDVAPPADDMARPAVRKAPAAAPAAVRKSDRKAAAPARGRVVAGSGTARAARANASGRPAAGQRRNRVARRAGTVNAFAAASARAATATGGGTAPAPTPSGELPMTGLATWIAAIAGALLLALGVCVHVNAVRLGMKAMLYRRGILLRPVDCARLAQEQGLPRLRVLVSNALHRLLEEPAPRSGEFVSARLAR